MWLLFTFAQRRRTLSRTDATTYFWLCTHGKHIASMRFCINESLSFRSCWTCANWKSTEWYCIITTFLLIIKCPIQKRKQRKCIYSVTLYIFNCLMFETLQISFVHFIFNGYKMDSIWSVNQWVDRHIKLNTDNANGSKNPNETVYSLFVVVVNSINIYILYTFLFLFA